MYMTEDDKPVWEDLVNKKIANWRVVWKVMTREAGRNIPTERVIFGKVLDITNAKHGVNRRNDV